MQHDQPRAALARRARPARCPTQAVTPDASSPSLTTNSEAMKITVGSPKPASACSSASTPVAHSASATPMRDDRDRQPVPHEQHHGGAEHEEGDRAVVHHELPCDACTSRPASCRSRRPCRPRSTRPTSATAATPTARSRSVYPALARVPADLFGICVVGTSGRVYAAGDADHEFTIMSVSKPFVFALVCERLGPARAARPRSASTPPGCRSTRSRPSSAAADGRTNPMVNSGAIATTSLAPGLGTFLHEGLSRFAGRELRARRGGLRVRDGDQRAQPGHRAAAASSAADRDRPRPSTSTRASARCA